MRIKALIKDVQDAQKRHGVELYLGECGLHIIDTRRTEDWTQSDGVSYGDTDAFISSGKVRLRNLSIEDFGGWEG